MFQSICHYLPSPLTSRPSKYTLIMALHIGTKKLAPGRPPYTNWLSGSHIIPSSVLQIMHSNVMSDTIRPLGPHILWGDLVTIFRILVLGRLLNNSCFFDMACSHDSTMSCKFLIFFCQHPFIFLVRFGEGRPSCLLFRYELLMAWLAKGVSICP